MSAGPTFQLSSLSPAVGERDLRRLAAALAIAGAEVALAWGLAVPGVSVLAPGAAPDPRSAQVVMVPTLDIAAAAGFHSTDPEGAPYGRVLATEAIPAAEWQRAASHELIETLVDPRCNGWALDWDGRMWALEACDPVQADWYGLDLGDGGPPVAVSNWCTPAWFTDPVPSRPALDRMGLVPAPWTVRPGGYAVTYSGGRVSAVSGPQERPAASRWARRMASEPGRSA